jgi:ketosteroid isomerase-like protein
VRVQTAHVALAVQTLIAGCAAEPPPAAVDLAAEKAAVEQVLQDELSGASQPGQAGADGYVAVMTDDVVLLPSNAKRLDGKEAVREWALQSTSAEDWSPTWAPNLVVVAASGDVATRLGPASSASRTPTGTPSPTRESRIPQSGVFRGSLGR